MLTIVSVLQPLPALGYAARRPHCSLPLTLSSTGSCVLWKGDLGWAAALLSAGHLGWMCIGHKENQVRVHGWVQMVTGPEPADHCFLGASDSAGVTQDSRWPHVSLGPCSLSSFLLGEGPRALQRFCGCSSVNCAFRL